MSDSRARIWFALFVLVVFCLGGAGGFILGRHAPGFAGPFGPLEDPRGPGGPFGPGGRRGGPPPFGRGGPGGPAGLPPEVAGRLANELQLDETQRAQFRKVLDDHRGKFEQVHREARERFEAEQRELLDGIRRILRPDQVQRLDDFMNRRRP
jgi:uncharacterized membrane protein